MQKIHTCYAVAYIVAAAFVTTAAQAQPVNGSNQPEHAALVETAMPDSVPGALSALKRDWDHAGFTAPTKPAQAIVNGRDGRTTSGAGYNDIVELMRGAEVDARDGREQRAMAKIAEARHLLDR